jgi:hypothetical protein
MGGLQDLIQKRPLEGLMRNLRIYTCAGSALAAVIAVSTISVLAYGASASPDISGIWWATEYHAKIQLVGGGELPLTNKGKAAYAMNIAGLKDGSIIDTARKWCVPDGIPRLLATPFPFEIVQAPANQITIVYELNHQVRLVALDKPMPKPEELLPFPYYNGHSVGHWDGGTQVIDTAGFNDKTFIDASGAPHTDEMTTTERLRKISPTELEDIVTVHDPDYYTRDWSTRFIYRLRNDVRLEDYVCGEKHRDISMVKVVHRP